MKLVYLAVVFFIILTKVQCKTDISCSVFLYGENDWYTHDRSKQINCIKQVDRVRANCGGSNINFVITQFWFDTNSNMIPEAYATKFGTKYIKTNNTNVKLYRNGMGRCIKHAIRQKFKVLAVTPHLDDGLASGRWRNALVLNPLTKYDGQYSYYDAIIKPVVDAFNGAVGDKKDVQIYFSMQGEMNLMVWKYPREWLKMVNMVRARLPGDAKAGISLNFNKMCGLDPCDPQTISSVVDVKGARVLVENVDFVGISGYSKVTPELATNEFQYAAFVFEKELRMFGIDLRKVISKPGVEFHYSEFGIGGASCSRVVAKTVEEVGKCPYYGIHDQYNASTDPWKNPALRDYVVKYYKQAVRWAAQGTGPEFKVSQIYVWNVASWDVMGIYHYSYSRDGSYKNDEVIKIVKQWNDFGKIV